MIEDSEMVLRMDAKRREKMEIQERTRQEMERAREEERIEANTEHSHVQILNQELEILRLEFQIEEEGLDSSKDMTESIDVNKSYYCGCCCCLTNGDISIQKVPVRSSALREFLHVNNKVDAERKMEEIKKRYEQLHDFGWPSCQNFMTAFESFLCVMLLGNMMWIPHTLCSCCAYNCYSCIRNGNYRRNSRTGRILKVYERFGGYWSQAKLKTSNGEKITELNHQLLFVKKKPQSKENMNCIQLLNMDLQNLEAEFVLEEVKHKDQTETIRRFREVECGCFTSQLEVQSMDCSAAALKIYFKVDKTQDFSRKLKRLKELDGKLGTLGCDCCMSATKCFMSRLRQVSQEKPKDNKISEDFMFLWPCFPICAAFISPCLLAASCYECCGNQCKRSSSRIHRIYKVYEQYSSSLLNFSP